MKSNSMTSGGDVSIIEAHKEPNRPAFWVAVVGLSQAWKLVVSVVSSIVLGRLLTPNDFGLVATIGPLVAMADLLRDLGFTQAVIQRKTISKGQVNALFWLSMAVTFAIATLLSVASPFVATFFEEPRLTLLLIVASWSLLIGSLGSLPIAWLNRNLRFSAIALIESCASGVGLLAAATLAWYTHSYWALILGSVAYSGMAAMLSLGVSGWAPGRPQFDGVVGEMVRFGAGVSTANISNFIARNADNLLIAKADGPVPLGLYDRAYKLMLVPLTQMTWPVSRVLTPILSRQLGDQKAYERTYFTTISYLMIFGQPGVLFCIVFSQDVVLILLGQKWIGVGPIFAWLGIAGLQQLVTSSIVWLFISQGRAKSFATLGIANSAIAVLSFFVGLPWGPLGVAASFTIFDLLLRAPLSWWYATRRGPISLASTSRILLPHLVALGACTACLVAAAENVTSLGKVEATIGLVLTYGLYLVVLSAWPSKRALIRSGIEVVSKKVRRLVS